MPQARNNPPCILQSTTNATRRIAIILGVELVQVGGELGRADDFKQDDDPVSNISDSGPFGKWHGSVVRNCHSWCCPERQEEVVNDRPDACAGVNRSK